MKWADFDQVSVQSTDVAGTSKREKRAAGGNTKKRRVGRTQRDVVVKPGVFKRARLIGPAHGGRLDVGDG